MCVCLCAYLSFFFFFFGQMLAEMVKAEEGAVCVCCVVCEDQGTGEGEGDEK